jgi:hypothetical protein
LAPATPVKPDPSSLFDSDIDMNINAKDVSDVELYVVASSHYVHHSTFCSFAGDEPADKDNSYSEHATSDVDSGDNPDLAVMQKDLQDPSLYRIYENLPRLRYVSYLVEINFPLIHMLDNFVTFNLTLLMGSAALHVSSSPVCTKSSIGHQLSACFPFHECPSFTDCFKVLC